MIEYMDKKDTLIRARLRNVAHSVWDAGKTDVYFIDKDGAPYMDFEDVELGDEALKTWSRAKEVGTHLEATACSDDGWAEPLLINTLEVLLHKDDIRGLTDPDEVFCVERIYAILPSYIDEWE